MRQNHRDRAFHSRGLPPHSLDRGPSSSLISVSTGQSAGCQSVSTRAQGTREASRPSAPLSGKETIAQREGEELGLLAPEQAHFPLRLSDRRMSLAVVGCSGSRGRTVLSPDSVLVRASRAETLMGTSVHLARGGLSPAGGGSYAPDQRVSAWGRLRECGACVCLPVSVRGPPCARMSLCTHCLHKESNYQPFSCLSVADWVLSDLSPIFYHSRLTRNRSSDLMPHRHTLNHSDPARPGQEPESLVGWSLSGMNQADSSRDLRERDSSDTRTDLQLRILDRKS